MSGAREPSHRRQQRIAAGLVVVALCVWALYRAAGSRREVVPEHSTLQLHLDPNVARWEELATLPHIGEHAAKRIVEFRQKQVVRGNAVAFTKPEDLDAVEGIGPRTIEEIRVYLKFPE